MPAVKPGVKVLVTGANGYLAMWTVQKLLDRGYSVRGTVRSTSKGTYLSEYFKGYGGRFEIAVVPDITVEGAFDESLVGITAVLHVATPLPNAKITDPEEYIKPAVDGTLSIMKSALNAPNVKRFIYTSTTGTTMTTYELPGPTLITENDWNYEAIQEVEKKGKDAQIRNMYISSKVFAERAAWDLYEKNKNTGRYDFLTVHPPWIFGPPIHDLGNDGPSDLGASLAPLYEICVCQETESVRTEDVLKGCLNWADVRDLADTHVVALETENAAGERIQVVEGNTSWQQWIDTFNEVSSSISLSRPLPVGKPGLPPKVLDIYDTNKAYRILGMRYKHIYETARDTLEFFANKGWC